MTNAPDLSLETDAFATGAKNVCGIDEAGRGPWAGPVVAAAVILDTAWLPHGINDSKKLTERARDELAAAIHTHAQVGVGLATVEEIDRLNIRAATFLAMARAVAALPALPDMALIDGRDTPDVGCPARAVIKGDGRSLSIAAASIIAKTTRDAMMVAMDADFPGYGFARHKGYGTKAHRAALEKLGITPHHRKSFAPIALLHR
ncbi:ribonuclease HII [Pyruvatibacter sp.]|uniref:ribonuclease HII n=1 Tax=Pyruvatibacter sp. TaxID=1981328 RepID=UPI0032EC33CB